MTDDELLERLMAEYDPPLEKVVAEYYAAVREHKKLNATTVKPDLSGVNNNNTPGSQ
ncbi:hypothetical protein [Mesorhizobium sp. M8A.F.Ca.ET.165.01.1.1]|uniref:hypothetical protein n=1 Tax=Mesorhizobium sp. M8A.F.Ca.ET.165.01.1.1 TaxID=2563960 RepID=UPI001673A6D6|nr:hypothetical protein [Mesorhizobium sp. M8A.F.Ca.ET.165.01.1.1]